MFEGDGETEAPGAWRHGPAPVSVEVRQAGSTVSLLPRVSFGAMEREAAAGSAMPGGPSAALAAAVEMVRVAQSLPWWDEAPGLSARAPEDPWVASAAVAAESALTSPAARALETARPGPALAAKLAGSSVADADDAAVVEMVAGWERVAAWAAAQQARALSELAARRRRPRNGVFTSRGAVVEVEARLGTTLHAAERKVALAAALEELPVVADALAAGRVDVRKADVLCFEEPGLTADERRGVLADLVPEAEWLTVPQLRERMRRAAQRAGVAAARRRHVREHAGRRVVVEAAGESMSWVSAYLRADHAEAVRAVVDALADGSKAPGETRTLDQRRADAFADVFTTMLERGTGPAGSPLPRRHGQRAHVQVTVASGTLLGLDEEPAVLGGYGPIPAWLAREIAQDGTWRALFTDAGTGEFVALGTKAYRPGAELTRTVMARDVTCTFPGCRMPAPRCEIDHIPGYDAALAEVVVQTRLEDLHTACHTHHDGKSHGIWKVFRDPGTGVTTWKALTGHTYRRPPVRPPGPPPDPGPAPPVPPDDEPPPF
ncbi:uncharacterized protein DUF222 [Georgenia soli]|uniref:Uncharacterized protein DUF222 n=1 Tax=Georgenia soli TaxID=638953 RepID=A0A2A9ESL5_9MICO|nr:HNH endonuclease signature motif containing protein [Georgenia soli]PFG41260.1 uncharacterized protein DUF222 [Georgenia soli]